MTLLINRYLVGKVISCVIDLAKQIWVRLDRSSRVCPDRENPNRLPPNVLSESQFRETTEATGDVSS